MKDKMFGNTNRIIRDLNGDLMEVALFVSTEKIARALGLTEEEKRKLGCLVSHREVAIADAAFDGVGRSLRNVVGLPDPAVTNEGAPCGG